MLENVQPNSAVEGAQNDAFQRKGLQMSHLREDVQADGKAKGAREVSFCQMSTQM